MSLKEQVLAAAEQVLTEYPDGLTLEALARKVSQAVGRQLPPRQVADALRSKPERFVEGAAGRWRLRERQGVLPDEEEPDVPGDTAAARSPLRRGCYAVFDLEATGPSPEPPQTELLQIAAPRYIDGVPGEVWIASPTSSAASFGTRPSSGKKSCAVTASASASKRPQ